MKRLVFAGSVLGTLAALLAACLAVLATVIWLLRQWEPAPWVLWAVRLGMMGAAVALIWRWWRLPSERRFRFTLRGMLIGIALFALWFGVVGTDVLRWGREAAAIAELQQHYVTTPEYYYLDYFGHGPLVKRFGYDPLAGVHNIEIFRDQGLAAVLEHADVLPDLEGVNFEGGRISDAALARVDELNQFPELRSGGIARCRITDTGLERLTAWKRLEDLHLYNCAKITDAGLAHLKKLPNLRSLTLLQENKGKMPVTDAGLVHVADLQQLRLLRIIRIPVTDAGIAHLHRLKSIEHIHFTQTKVTDEGVNALCEALPDCLVTWEEAWFPAVCQIRGIEIWRVRPEEKLATITDVDQIAAVKAWFEEASKQRYPNCSGSPAYWQDGTGGACLSLRFEGRRRRMYEVGLGNGVYSTWGRHCSMSAADEQDLRTLLGVHLTERNTDQAVH